MNLTWHIAWKDLRHLAPGAGIWILFQVVTLTLAWIMREELFGYDGPGEDVFWMWHYAMVIMTGVIVYFLVGMLCQEDPVTAPAAFWLTRPISRRRLLAAKALAIGVLFCLLPIVLRLPWWLTSGYGPREVAWAGVETAVLHVAIASPALLLASMTADFRDFGRWTAGAVAVGLVGLVTIVATVDALNGSLMQTPWRLVLGAGAVLCLVTSLLQILLRRRTLALLVVGIGSFGVLGNLVAWKKSFPQPGEEYSEGPVTIAARFAPARAPAGAMDLPLVLDLDLDATPSDGFATLSSVLGVKARRGPFIPVGLNTEKTEWEAAGVDLALHGSRSRGRRVAVPLALNDVGRRRLGDDLDGVRVVLAGWLWTVEDVAEIPLRDEARVRQSRQQLWIRNLWYGTNDSKFAMSLNEVVPLLAADGAQVVLENDGVRPELEEIYLLVNRPRGEAMPLSRHMWATRSATVGLRRVDLTLQAPLSAEWRREALLVKITLRRTGAFAREVEVAR